MDISPEQLGTSAGSGVVGTLIAWFTLKGKIEKSITIQKDFKATVEEAIREIKESVKSIEGKTVLTATCTECKDNRDNQFHALNEKLDILLERRRSER